MEKNLANFPYLCLKLDMDLNKSLFIYIIILI